MLEHLQEEILKEFPKFKLVPKLNSRFMRLLDLCLKLITLWRMDAFMTAFTTTVGCTVYTPSTWETRPPKSKMIILRHERVHMRQRRRLGWWYAISYLFLPLPTIWAYFRLKYEMEAYEESLRAVLEYYGPPSFTPVLKKSYVSYLTGPAYFWTWPWRRRIERWYDGTVKHLTRTVPF